MERNPGAIGAHGASKSLGGDENPDTEIHEESQCSILRLPRRQLHRRIVVWKWGDGRFTAVMINQGGEASSISKAFRNRWEAEWCARKCAADTGIPFTPCGIAADGPDGPGRAA